MGSANGDGGWMEMWGVGCGILLKVGGVLVDCAGGLVDLSGLENHVVL